MSVCFGAFFFFQAEDGIRDHCVTGVQTCALPISAGNPLNVLSATPSLPMRMAHISSEDCRQVNTSLAPLPEAKTLVLRDRGACRECLAILTFRLPSTLACRLRSPCLPTVK